MTKETGAVQKTHPEQENKVKQFLQILIDSKQLPSHVKNINEAYTIAQMGKELGFATMQAFHYIIPIQGRLSLSAKAIGGLLRKGGVEYITKEDGIYIFADGTTDTLSPKTDGTKPIDQRTTIIFYRNGREETCSFTWKDADKQGLTTKDNWKRMAKEMLFARCLSKGANRIGADLLLGLYTTEEMTDALNISENNIKRNDDGMIAEIIDIS